VLYPSFPEFQRALTQTLDSLNADSNDHLAILYVRMRRKAIRNKYMQFSLTLP
jgi:hypothetical protein